MMGIYVIQCIVYTVVKYMYINNSNNGGVYISMKVHCIYNQGVGYIPLNSAAYLRVTLVEQSMSSFLSARLTGQYCPKSPTRCRNSSGVMHMSAMDAA